MKSHLFSLFVLVSLAFVSVAAAPRQEGTPPPPPATLPPWAVGVQASSAAPQMRTPGESVMTAETMRGLLPKLGGGAQQVLAPKLGVTSIGGKKLNIVNTLDLDNIVNVDNNVSENNPSLAVNPKNEAIVAAAHQYYSSTEEKCIAQVSFDGGETFDYKNSVFLPLQATPVGRFCAYPIVRFSPDGLYAYYFYMDGYFDDKGTPDPNDDVITSDIVLVRADGYDPTNLLTGPIVVLDDQGDFLDRPWGDVAYYDTSGFSDAVIYVTSTRFGTDGSCSILFNASQDHGNTWMYTDQGAILASQTNCEPLVQGSRPIGGPTPGWVTACWYDSESDGWLAGKFDIRCWSNDSWGDNTGGTNYFFTAVNDQRYELPAYLGPKGSYHSWWGAMFPSLAVDNTGLLYIAYAADPTSNAVSSNAESGDVFLARGWPSGTSWGRLTIADGSSLVNLAQGFATVTARCSYITNKCYAYVAFEDYLSVNKLYRIAYRKATRPRSPSVPGTFSLSGKVVISDALSFSDYYFVSDYIDSFATSRRYEVIWTDRSDVSGPVVEDDDVMHDVLLP